MRTFDLPAAIDYIQANQFVELIGHCRYDTSGDWREINNNQPIVIGNSILAFNGVVRMSTKEEYEAEFQREYTTANDGEIVLRMFAEEGGAGTEKLLQESRVTFAGVLRVNGRTLALRNSGRPLWIAEDKGVKFVFSTLDIFKRAVRSVPHPEKYALMDHHEVPPMEVQWL
jgi:glutamine phosphoribosylpyrophosphate amidotransferase